VAGFYDGFENFTTGQSLHSARAANEQHKICFCAKAFFSKVEDAREWTFVAQATCRSFLKLQK
jgi:hypothetical protein